LNSTCFIVDSLTIWYDRIDEGLIHGCDINILVNNLLPTINITNPKLKIEMCGCGESFIVNQDS
jgi:Fe-S cluster assembly iron-binding protein IscA